VAPWRLDNRDLSGKNERARGEYGRLNAERAVQQYLFGSVRDVSARESRADAHVDVIDTTPN